MINRTTRPCAAKRLSPWALGALGGTALAVAGSGLAAAADKIELTELVYTSHGQAWKDYLNAKEKAFEALHPDIHITFVDSGGSEATKLNVLLTAGTPPDIADFYPAMASPFIGKDVFLNLNPYIARDKVNLSAYMKPTIDAFEANGELWGLPMSIYPIPAWYNLDLFNQAGLATPYQMGLDNWTWDTVRNYGKKLTVRDAQGKFTQLGLDRFAARPEIQIRQAGGMEYDKYVLPTKSQWASQPVVDAISYISSIINDDQSASASFLSDFYYWTGRSGIDLVDGPGILGVYMSKAKFQWDIAPQPKGPANRGTLVTPGLGLQILKASKHADAAWEWIKFLAVDPQGVKDFVSTTGGMPSLLSVVKEYPQYATTLPAHWQVFSDVSLDPASYSGYIVPDTRITSAANAGMKLAFTGKMPAQSAMKQVDEQVTAFFKEDNAK
ncbi:MAG TPA: extracellular solute-binding protein [Limnochordia bacterium]|nr:extracellular solute-binding protein [Limnochordia bacterium]